MSDPEGLLNVALLGNRAYPRYAITLNRAPFSPTLYWTGTVDERWSKEVIRAMRWADTEAAIDAIRSMGTAEPDSPGVR